MWCCPCVVVEILARKDANGGSCFIITDRNYRENLTDVLQSTYGSINVPDFKEWKTNFV